MSLSDAHLAELRTAKRQLEATPFLIKVANAIGKPLDSTVAALPAAAREAILGATRAALDKGLEWALGTVGTTKGTKSRPWLHTTVVTASGGVGGAFGWSALAVELPFSTIVMLRSIAAIAQENGEDLRTAETRLQCLAVLSYGGPTSADDAAETTYYASRAALSTSLQRAAAQLATAVGGGKAPRAAHLVASFISKVAARFGVVVHQKAIAQTVPVAGAIGGAALNHLFIGHFQQIANGHFTVRRLERIYGEDEVKEAYEAIEL